MGRKRKDIQRLHVTLPRELKERIDLWLLDPVAGRSRWGAFSTITQHLWVHFLRTLEDPNTDTVKLLRQYGIDIKADLEGADDDEADADADDCESESEEGELPK